MRQSIADKNRKKLENKMAKVLEEDMKSLPAEFRKIMVDDLMTAFESRLGILSRVQSNLKFITITEGEIQVETR